MLWKNKFYINLNGDVELVLEVVVLTESFY